MYSSRVGQSHNKPNSNPLSKLKNSVQALARAELGLPNYIFQPSPTVPNSARLEYNSSYTSILGISNIPH
jgi:hypothetical protein